MRIHLSGILFCDSDLPTGEDDMAWFKIIKTFFAVRFIDDGLVYMYEPNI